MSSLALIGAAGVIPIWQNAERWVLLAAIAASAVIVVACAIGFRTPRLLGWAALGIAVEEVVALGVGNGFDLRALPLGILLFAGLELAYWACDTNDVRVELPVRLTAIGSVTGLGVLAAAVVSGISALDVRSSLLVTGAALAAAAATVVMISRMAVRGHPESQVTTDSPNRRD